MRTSHADIRVQAEQQARFSGAGLAFEGILEAGSRLERAAKVSRFTERGIFNQPLDDSGKFEFADGLGIHTWEFTITCVSARRRVVENRA